MNSHDLFQRLGLPYEALDGQLSAQAREDFKRQYRDLFRQEKARNATRVIYIWSTQTPIPRVRGGSNVVYIGKTIGRLSARYLEWIGDQTSGDNWLRSRHIIRVYGPMIVCFAKHHDPKQAETMLLESYFEAHLDYPPINRKGK